MIGSVTGWDGLRGRSRPQKAKRANLSRITKLLLEETVAIKISLETNETKTEHLEQSGKDCCFCQILIFKYIK